MTIRLSRAEVDALAVTTDVPTAGRALGIDRDTAYDMARAGVFPCPVIRAGRRWIVPTAGLRRVLGLETGGE